MSASLAEQQAEQKKWANKHFDYADTPIKEWIAAVLDEDINHLFTDFRDTCYTECLDVKDESGTMYMFYYTVYPDDETTFVLDPETINDSAVLSRAMRIMFDAIYTVFMPVVKTMSNMSHRMENMFPLFDATTHTFRLVCINSEERKKTVLYDTMRNVFNQSAQLKKNVEILTAQYKQAVDDGQEDDAAAYKAKLNEAHELAQRLQNVVKEVEQKLDEIPDSLVQRETQRVEQINQSLVDAPRLYLCCERNLSGVDMEKCMQELPEIGLKFQDPDQENYIDRIKKQYSDD